MRALKCKQVQEIRHNERCSSRHRFEIITIRVTTIINNHISTHIIRIFYMIAMMDYLLCTFQVREYILIYFLVLYRNVLYKYD